MTKLEIDDIITNYIGAIIEDSHATNNDAEWGNDYMNYEDNHDEPWDDDVDESNLIYRVYFDDEDDAEIFYKYLKAHDFTTAKCNEEVGHVWIKMEDIIKHIDMHLYFELEAKGLFKIENGKHMYNEDLSSYEYWKNILDNDRWGKIRKDESIKGFDLNFYANKGTSCKQYMVLSAVHYYKNTTENLIYIELAETLTTLMDDKIAGQKYDKETAVFIDYIKSAISDYNLSVTEDMLAYICDIAEKANKVCSVKYILPYYCSEQIDYSKKEKMNNLFDKLHIHKIIGYDIPSYIGVCRWFYSNYDSAILFMDSDAARAIANYFCTHNIKCNGYYDEIPLMGDNMGVDNLLFFKWKDFENTIM